LGHPWLTPLLVYNIFGQTGSSSASLLFSIYIENNNEYIRYYFILNVRLDLYVIIQYVVNYIYDIFFSVCSYTYFRYQKSILLYHSSLMVLRLKQCWTTTTTAIICNIFRLKMTIKRQDKCTSWPNHLIIHTIMKYAWQCMQIVCTGPELIHTDILKVQTFM
jgi:hypothetical protein